MILRTICAGALLACGITVPAIAAGEAEDVWAQSCARCHRDVSSLVVPYAGRDPDELRAELDVFLARHRAPDPELRAALVEWLLAQVSE